jgi:hypothetical protein
MVSLSNTKIKVYISVGCPILKENDVDLAIYLFLSRKKVKITH